VHNLVYVTNQYAHAAAHKSRLAVKFNNTHTSFNFI
jgi:hypothetical protein